MAADWIPMRIDLRDDPAVVTIALKVQLGVDDVVGKLLKVWGWAGAHTTNGKLTGVLRAHVDHAAGCVGFAEGMEAAGWLEITEPDVISFPRWKNHNGKSAKNRLQSAKRMAKMRDAEAAKVLRGARNGCVTTEERHDSDKRATVQSANQCASGSDLDAAGGALAARTPAESFEIAKILRGLWPKSPKAHDLSKHANATPARVCWLFNRIRAERIKAGPGFMEKGIKQGWDVPPEWQARFDAATGAKPALKIAGGAA